MSYSDDPVHLSNSMDSYRSSSYLKMTFRKDLKPGPSFAQGVLLGEAFADMMYDRPIRTLIAIVFHSSMMQPGRFSSALPGLSL